MSAESVTMNAVAEADARPLAAMARAEVHLVQDILSLAKAAVRGAKNSEAINARLVQLSPETREYVEHCLREIEAKPEAYTLYEIVQRLPHHCFWHWLSAATDGLSEEAVAAVKQELFERYARELEQTSEELPSYFRQREATLALGPAPDVKWRLHRLYLTDKEKRHLRGTLTPLMRLYFCFVAALPAMYCLYAQPWPAGAMAAPLAWAGMFCYWRATDLARWRCDERAIRYLALAHLFLVALCAILLFMVNFGYWLIVLAALSSFPSALGPYHLWLKMRRTKQKLAHAAC